MREGATVKQFMDAIEEMRKVYPFKDESARMAIMDFHRMTPNHLTVITTDEKTGVVITMSKDIPGEV